MKLTKINMLKGNRIVRIGFGQYEGKWFARIDLWFWGFRVNER